MKNIFDYAGKELSQDAFLRWLFESYEEEEAGKLVRLLLQQFCGLEEEILTITTYAQERYIDLRIEIITKSGRKIQLFIEDKTFSNEHRQLKRYDRHINGITEECHKIFYKTNFVNDDDKAGIDEANIINMKEGKACWKVFDIDMLLPLFQGGKPYKNILLQSYVEHLEKIKNILYTTQKPRSSVGRLDCMQWIAYFKNTIEPRLSKKGYTCESWGVVRFTYACLVIRKNGLKDIPYMEIRSRDCVGDSFKAYILCYGIDKGKGALDEAVKLKQDKLLSDIGNNNGKFHKIKKIRRVFPKHVGITNEIFAHSVDDFIRQVEECAAEYLELVKDWN